MNYQMRGVRHYLSHFLSCAEPLAGTVRLPSVTLAASIGAVMFGICATQGALAQVGNPNASPASATSPEMGAVRILSDAELQQLATTPASMRQNAPSNISNAPAASSNTSVSRYQVRISNPSTVTTYRKPAQSIDASVELTPTLAAGDTVSWLLNGEPVATGVSVSIPTLTLNPDGYQLTAVVHPEGEDSFTGVKGMATTQIYVILNTQVVRRQKELEAQIIAYQRLPWYQKLMLQLGQKDVPANAQLPPPKAAEPTLENPTSRNPFSTPPTATR